MTGAIESAFSLLAFSLLSTRLLTATGPSSRMAQLFFSGTATEVMPIRSLDHIVIGDGKRGPFTERIQARYQEIINGRADDVYGWMSWQS